MTSIEWTDETWNPVRGCSRVSPGCDNCYAMRQAHRFNTPSESSPYHGLTTIRRGKVDWSGRVRLVREALDQPVRWRKPRRIFVNSMSDLFHEALPDEEIAAVFGVMAACPQHTFQCLTKRPERMREFLCDPRAPFWVAQARDAAIVNFEHARDPEERWCTIPGFETYDASSHGRLRNSRGQILKTHINKRTGREAITLSMENTPKTLAVHLLVMLAHTRGHTEGMEVCHRNGDKRDNRLANLRWGTRSQNQREKVDHGSRGGPQKLTEAQVLEIKAARGAGETQQTIADRFGVSRSLVSMIESGQVWCGPETVTWPLPNVWLGVSAEDQQRADERVPHLLATPAVVRFVSAEPLLGPIDFDRIVWETCGDCDPCIAGVGRTQCGQRYPLRCLHEGEGGIDWVIVGGESGNGARPFDVQWARDVVRQCRKVGVACFVKQLGANVRDRNDAGFDGNDGDAWDIGERLFDAVEHDPDGIRNDYQGAPVRIRLCNRKGGDPEEWPADLRVREFPEVRE